MCWNQLKRDFEFWLQQNGAHCNEISVYVQGLASTSFLPSDKNDIENFIKDVTDKWPQSVVDCFNVYLKFDMINHAAK